MCECCECCRTVRRASEFVFRYQLGLGKPATAGLSIRQQALRVGRVAWRWGGVVSGFAVPGCVIGFCSFAVFGFRGLGVLRFCGFAVFGFRGLGGFGGFGFSGSRVLGFSSFQIPNNAAHRQSTANRRRSNSTCSNTTKQTRNTHQASIITRQAGIWVPRWDREDLKCPYSAAQVLGPSLWASVVCPE